MVLPLTFRSFELISHYFLEMKIHHYECNVNQIETFTPKYLYKVLKVTDRRYTNYCNLQALAQVMLKQQFSNLSLPQKPKG